MEIMDTDLTSIISKNYDTYTENVVKYILKRALIGLAHLHRMNIIHRDIKSDNVLVNSKGSLKLADFGYSTRLASAEDNRLSRVGTMAWMAPEIIRGKKMGYNTSIDIWSFGIMAVELAHGDAPNIKKTQAEMLRGILRDPSPTLGARWSPQFQDFVDQCLIKDP